MAAVKGLRGLEREIIELFVQISRALGQPRSVAEIYGLLFISARPLAMDDFIHRLRQSKGSASMGLKFLRGIGAVKVVSVPGNRRVHYVAECELGKLVAQFVEGELMPQFRKGRERLERIGTLARALPAVERARVERRLGRLRSWGRDGKRFLPALTRILGC